MVASKKDPNEDTEIRWLRFAETPFGELEERLTRIEPTISWQASLVPFFHRLKPRLFSGIHCRVSTVQEIEKAIEHLPEEEFFGLVDRLRARHAELWDRQIEADAKAGRLDFIWEEAKREIAQGKTRPLDEIINDQAIP